MTSIEYERVREQDKMTLVAIHHPNHFEGKWTLLAMFPRIKQNDCIRSIISEYDQEAAQRVSIDDLTTLLGLSHDGIEIEDFHDFIFPDQPCQQLLEKEQITVQTMAQILSRKNIPFDKSSINLHFGERTFKKLEQSNTSGPEWPKSVKCKC